MQRLANSCIFCPMPHPQAEEPGAELVAEARKAGFAVTRPQLRRWQQAGLLPAPRQRGLGRGRGTEVLYPAGSARQLVRLCQLREEVRALGAAAWALWWEGFPVAEERIRALLDQQLRFAEGLRELAQRQLVDGEGDAERDLVAVFEESGRKRLLPVVGRARRRTGRQHFPMFLGQLVRTVSGLPVELADDDAEIATKGLYLGSPKEAEAALRAASSALDPRRLREALASATLEELEETRDEIRAVLDLLGAANQLLALAMGREIDQPFLGSLARPSLADGSHLALLWLSLHRMPEVRATYERFLPALQAVNAGTRTPAEVLNDG